MNIFSWFSAEISGISLQEKSTNYSVHSVTEFWLKCLHYKFIFFTIFFFCCTMKIANSSQIMQVAFWWEIIFVANKTRQIMQRFFNDRKFFMGNTKRFLFYCYKHVLARKFKYSKLFRIFQFWRKNWIFRIVCHKYVSKIDNWYQVYKNQKNQSIERKNCQFGRELGKTYFRFTSLHSDFFPKKLEKVSRQNYQLPSGVAILSADMYVFFELQNVSETIVPTKNPDKETTVFENHRKSLIQHCEQSELRL